MGFVRLERLEARFEHVEGVVGDIEAAAQISVTALASCPRRGFCALQGVEAAGGAGGAGALPGGVAGGAGPESAIEDHVHPAAHDANPLLVQQGEDAVLAGRILQQLLVIFVGFLLAIQRDELFGQRQPEADSLLGRGIKLERRGGDGRWA